MDIGNGLKKLRKEKYITQGDLATVSQLDKTHISAIETGRRNPTTSSLIKLLTHLDTDYITFLTDYCGVKQGTKPESSFDLLNEENQKQVSDYIEFLIARQSFK